VDIVVVVVVVNLRQGDHYLLDPVLICEINKIDLIIMAL
jgi:hypothetical protein